MSAYVVWIDTDHARVFKLQSPAMGGANQKAYRRRVVKHHTSSDPEKQKDCEAFFHQIADAVRDAEELLLLGPGLAKEHFKSHLARHHHAALASRVIGTQTVDQMSDAQVLATSREFFKIYSLFGGAVAESV